MKRFLRYHLPAILYGGLIIGLSSIPDWGQKQSYILGYDKILHFFEYGFFAVIIFRSFSNISQKFSLMKIVSFSLIFITIFACLDEYYQSHIPGRDSDIYDALFDFLGATLIVLILAFKKNFSKTK